MVLLAMAVFALCALSTFSAYRARGAVVGGVLLDPFCAYSAVSVPGMPPVPLRFPDRLVAVDGSPTRCDLRDGPFPSLAIDRHLRERQRRGQREVALTFARGSARIEVRPVILRLAPSAFVWLWALYFLSGLLVAWSGMAVLAVTRSAPGRAYALAALSAFVFLATFFDYHTTRLLVPLFSASTVSTGAGCVLLALHFPASPSRPAVGRAAAGAIAVTSLVLAAVLIVGPWLGADVIAVRVVASLYAPLCALVLVFAVIRRRSLSDETAHRQARSALLGMLVTLVAVAFGIAATMLNGATAIHNALPLVIAFTPLSVGWAIARHNVLGADLVLTRGLLTPPTAVLSTGIALAGWLVIRSGRDDTMQLWLPVAAAIALAITFFAAARRAVDGALFPARREFRPTIQLLAESLTGVTSAEDLDRSLVGTVTRWLPSTRVEVVRGDRVAELPHVPRAEDAALQAGQPVWTEESLERRILLVPMVSHATLRGVLAVASKRERALFTEDDIALLQTIAALGAVAHHNVAVVAELDAMRRIEVDATREDKAHSLWLLADQVQHELANPLNFVRVLLRHGATAPLDEEDVREGQGEIARMERMIAALRTLEFPRSRIEPVALVAPVSRALLLLREQLDARRVRALVDVPDGCAIRADFDKLVQVFANLLRNGAQAAPEGGRVGVSVRRDDAGGLVIDVWDDGPGVPADRVDQLFKRWVTSRSAEGGRGLGLALAQEFVTKFGWRIDYARDPGRTTFRIAVPASSVMPAGAEET